MTALACRFRLFAHQHDEVPAFHAAFLVSTILTAAIFPLGIFALLIGLHMLLDCIKYRDFFHLSILLTIRAVFLESIVDIALFLVALCFAVYFNTTFAITVTSGLIRSEFTIIRAIGTILPKVRIIEHLFTVLAHIDTYFTVSERSLHTSVTVSQRIALVTIGIAVVLLFSSVLIFPHYEIDLFAVLRHELRLHL